MDAQTAEEGSAYRIVVRGRLDESWSGWLDGMSVSVLGAAEGAPVTALTGPVVDQSALRGILNRLWDLNLTVISVNPVSKGSSCEEASR